MVTRPEDVLHVPHRVVMGLSAVAREADWILPDAELDADLAEKERLLAAQRGQVFVELPESRAAQLETLELLVEHLPRHHPGTWRRSGAGMSVGSAGRVVALEVPGDPPLLCASRLLQEDLVIMERGPSGWCLSAGCVCFPTRWDLPSKLGRPMEQIHERVPGYAGALSRSADRFFDGIKPGLPFQRGNWSLMDDPALFQPGGKFRAEANPDITPENAGQNVWLRREHQTLRLLPASGAVLFTIRILRQRLDAVARDPELALRLAESMRTMPDEMQRYKSLPVLEAAVRGYLGRQ